eukprot:CAMPEP_0171451584 /NCGR_PEP_ID=MMETSP0945-20130129/35_1 /TAXON_ID=109269 /ORGANISM="Vaucheria litorea, Strain CCMP2940" /LENGTH=67 /DNA_ID=CAMNT_0011976083 /DNA_START=510 /DNA_END=713 /DNA_ORIENTATION=+
MTPKKFWMGDVPAANAGTADPATPAAKTLAKSALETPALFDIVGTKASHSPTNKAMKATTRHIFLER